jgi:hypothetical protein
MAEDEQAAWVLHVLGIDVRSAALQKRLAAAATQLDGLKAEGPPELPTLLAAFAEAQAAITGPEGVAKLDALEAALARARAAARGRQGAKANVRGIAYPKLLLRWRAAQAVARGSLSTIASTVLGMAEVQADPRFAKVQTVLAGLPSLIPDFGSRLADLLDEGINAGTDAAIAPDALKVVADYRARLATVPLLGGIEQFAKKHVGDLAVLSELDGALAEIAATLQTAV